MNRIRIFNFTLFRFGKFVIVVILVFITVQIFIKFNKIDYNLKPFQWKNYLHPYHVFPSFSTPSPNLKKFSFGEECLNLSHIHKIHASDFANEDFELLKTEEGKKYKKILFYFHNEKTNFWFGFGKEPFEAACCKEKRCFTTAQRDKIPIEDFDALMIHFQQFSSQKLPKKRARHQRYIFYEKEPVPYTSRNLGAFEGVFNWTMTYRRDSDIYARYGEIHSKKDFSAESLSHYENTFEPIEKFMKTKKKMAVWMSSAHCKTPSKRENYVKEMQKYISVDIYGKCGSLSCDRKEKEKCYKMVEENYKFYLAFENNHCRDYITEKFFTLLTWKSSYIIFPATWFAQAVSYCDLCERLHSDKEEKIHYDLREWFVEKANCNKGL